MLMLRIPYYNKIAGSILSALLRSPYKKELEMRRVHFRYISPEDYSHLIDMYLKLEMRYTLAKIQFAHTQGSFNTVAVEAA